MALKDFFSKLLNWYFDKSPLLSADVPVKKLQSILSRDFDCSFIIISDNFYKTISRSVLDYALKTNFVKYIKYRSENFDCDDYSFVLCGQLKLMFPNLACGIVHSKTHAFNFVILDDLTVLVIEPQTNNLYTAKEFKDLYAYYPAAVVFF